MVWFSAAIGNGMRVGVVQFVKGKWETGERKVLEAFPDQVEFATMGEGFTWETQDRQRDIEAARRCLGKGQGDDHGREAGSGAAR